jgi:SecD/SecF fusion protein
MNSSGFVSMLLAQAETAAEPVQAAAASLTAGEPSQTAQEALGWMAILVLAAIVVLPFVFGTLIARWLKMKEIAFRMGVVLFALCIGLAPFVANKIQTGHWFEGAINFGIDLAGGTNLVYRVDEQATRALGKRVDGETMDKMREAIRNRVAPTGTEEVTVRRVGDDRIEVIVPGADAARTELVKRQITDLGSLEFSIVVNQKDHPELYDRGLEQVSKGSDPARKEEDSEIRVGGVLRARWVPVAFNSVGVPKIQGLDRGELLRPVTLEGKPGFEVLVLNEPDARQRITGDYLVNAREEMGNSGPVVGFAFNQEGGYRFQNLTWRYQPREGDPHRTKLAIILSGAVHSAPQINAVIGSNGIIEGNFTSAEIQALISVLNAGALEVPLIRTPVNEATVSPLLGADLRAQSETALWVALAGVFLVTALYYRVPGLIADLCLVINLLLLVGIMALIDATFTLPGLAGLVLSIGMAVDSNVLIFERMREEQERGASLRMGIQNGFSKALATIIDSNLTTLITAVVLYVIGTDAIKGFAVTLFIGIVVSMFTAVYVSRLIFDIAERKRWMTKFSVTNAIGITNVDFVGKTKVAVLGSLLLMLVGLAAVWMRGKNNFDIDFRGGVMVAFEFDGQQPTFEEAQTLLRKKLGDDISVEELEVRDESGQEKKLIRLRALGADTEDANADPSQAVSLQIDEAFQGTPYKLIRQHVTVTPATAIAAATNPANADEFAGGQQATIELTQAMQPASVRDEVVSQFDAINVQKYGDMATLLDVAAADGGDASDLKFVVRTKADVPAADLDKALAGVVKSLDGRPFFTEKNTFATSVGKEMQLTAVAAIVISLAAIILYLWFRFHGADFGLAACIALVHDVLITLGIVAMAGMLSDTGFGRALQLTDFKINLPMIAAFLTIVGYSLNDTIVVFDRIREVRGKSPRLTESMVNQSVNQTLSRTLLTSTTTLVVIVVLYLMGGEGIHGFCFTLFVGIIVGTYSTVYVASPVLLWLMNREHPKPAAAQPAMTGRTLATN